MPARHRRPGMLVPIAGGEALVPSPLPPKIDWNARLLRSLSDADRTLGRLAGEGGRLPNPHLLIRPFVRREAVLSSRIEGTQATLGELLAAVAGAEDRRRRAAPEDGVPPARRVRAALAAPGASSPTAPPPSWSVLPRYDCASEVPG